jgi:hypothetical protein
VAQLLTWRVREPRSKERSQLVLANALGDMEVCKEVGLISYESQSDHRDLIGVTPSGVDFDFHLECFDTDDRGRISKLPNLRFPPSTPKAHWRSTKVRGREKHRSGTDPALRYGAL